MSQGISIIGSGFMYASFGAIIGREFGGCACYSLADKINNTCYSHSYFSVSANRDLEAFSILPDVGVIVGGVIGFVAGVLIAMENPRNLHGANADQYKAVHLKRE